MSESKDKGINKYMTYLKPEIILITHTNIWNVYTIVLINNATTVEISTVFILKELMVIIIIIISYLTSCKDAFVNT